MLSCGLVRSLCVDDDDVRYAIAGYVDIDLTALRLGNILEGYLGAIR